jgi:RNA polymerase sigma-70 factor, ECF subfamily
LTPAERAAYILRHAFDYPYDAIAELLQFSNGNCRQLVRRAGRRIESGGRRPVSLTAHKSLVEAFRGAAHDGGFAQLEELLVAAVRRYRVEGSEVRSGPPPRHVLRGRLEVCDAIEPAVPHQANTWHY